MEFWLRISGICFSVLGTILLAWRAKKLMDTIHDIQMYNDASFRALLDHINGRPSLFQVVIGTEALKEGFAIAAKIMFGAGVASIIAGNVLVAISLWVGGTTT